MDARMAMIVITIISSRSVNPRLLPVFIFGSIESRSLGFGIYIEDVAAMPGVHFRIVLVGAETPVRGIRHRVHWNSAQKLQLLVHGAGQWHAIHQDLKRFGVTVRIDFHLDEAAVRRVLVLVYRSPYISQ